ANAALPHYSATPENNSKIKGDGMMLIDSGGQYWGGTTDITRVVPVGNTSAAMKRDYTLVLTAHISLAETLFPENIKGPMIDAICRKSHWQAQCDYGQCTG
ncbi:M24 family metallopeptidase, partial [Neisseria sp. P0001.S004]